MQNRKLSAIKGFKNGKSHYLCKMKALEENKKMYQLLSSIADDFMSAGNVENIIGTEKEDTFENIKRLDYVRIVKSAERIEFNDEKTNLKITSYTFAILNKRGYKFMQEHETYIKNEKWKWYNLIIGFCLGLISGTFIAYISHLFCS